jgi:hypothetical protein
VRSQEKETRTYLSEIGRNASAEKLITDNRELATSGGRKIACHLT